MIDNEIGTFYYEVNKLGIRHLQCILISISLAVTFALQVNMSIAIVAMTDRTSDSTFGNYEWSEMKKALILSSFFWGSIMTQVPAGQLARSYGGKTVMFGSIFISSVLTILTPLCASFGGCALVCVLRMLQGLCQSAVYPSMNDILSKWCPIEERGRLQTFCFCGSQLGTALMLCVSGEIVTSVWGWPGIFYISGAVSCFWAALWDFFASRSPEESHFITVEEKMYIQLQPDFPICESCNDSFEEEEPSKPPSPYKDILTSMPFWCLLFSHCTCTWGYYTLFTQIPSYLKNILGMHIKRNALFSSFPYWIMFLLSYLFLFLSEFLNSKEFSVSFNRKLFNTLSHWIPMIGLIALGYMVGSTETQVIVLLTLTVGMISASFPGYQLNHLDLSPNFVDSLMSLTNFAGNLMGAIAPLAVGFIVNDEKNPYQWSIVFFVAAGMFFIGNLLFIIFGKFKIQEWNEPETLNDGVSFPKRHNSINVECVY